MDEIRKIPFLRLLLPFLAGILAQYYLSIHTWSMIVMFVGITIMLFSYSIKRFKEYRFRWLFGLGLYFFLFSVGVFSTLLRQHQSVMNLRDVHEIYEAVIIDLPKDKPNSIALEVKLKDQDRQIICYPPKDSSSRSLRVGDGLTFFSKIEPFEKAKNKVDFDYARYMYNQGFCGFTFVDSDKWEKTDNNSFDVFITASKCRQSILEFYKSLDLSNTEYAILSGLTLGYKDALPEDLIESFRATGTAHILAVSGLHVGVIYFILVVLLGFIPRYSRFFKLKQILIIVLLWMYAFIVGLPPSAVRACIMLSMFCVGEIFNKRGYIYNTIFASAFSILLFNPFYLFDIGFQLSFVAVFSICLFMPFFSKIANVRNKYFRYFWNVFCMSIAAQIGILPLCLYYFGTFPTYFFAANLLIVPLVWFIIYDVLAMLLAVGVGFLVPFLSDYISYLPIAVFRIAVRCMTSITHFFETLPYALIEDVEISLVSVFVLWGIIASLLYFLIRKKPKALIASLVGCLFLITCGLVDRYKGQNTLMVYNNSKSLSVVYQIGYKKYDISDENQNRLLYLNGQKYLIVMNDDWNDKISDTKSDVDYLHLETEKSVSLYALNQMFTIKRVVLGTTLSKKTAKRFALECEKLRIPYYDVSDNGTLRINF